MTPTLAAFLDQHGFPRDQFSALKADRRFAPLMRACKEGRLDIERQNGHGATSLFRRTARRCCWKKAAIPRRRISTIFRRATWRRRSNA